MPCLVHLKFFNADNADVVRIRIFEPAEGEEDAKEKVASFFDSSLTPWEVDFIERIVF
jgi:hypothetical protein